MPAFLFHTRSQLGSADSAYRTCINTCAAVNAGAGVDSTFFTLLADGVNRAGVVTCAAVNALVGNNVSQEIHPLFLKSLLDN
jgi:hypothetical protein